MRQIKTASWSSGKRIFHKGKSGEKKMTAMIGADYLLPFMSLFTPQNLLEEKNSPDP